MCNERVCERAKEREGTYITSAETAQLSILFRVSAGFTTSSVWGRGCCLSAGANPDLHTCSIFPSSSSSYGWTLGASFVLLPPPSLKLLNLKKKTKYVNKKDLTLPEVLVYTKLYACGPVMLIWQPLRINICLYTGWKICMNSRTCSVGSVLNNVVRL